MAQEVFTSYEQAFEKIQPNASTYLVIVTRGHKEDMRVLAWAARTEARYIGMIGSNAKSSPYTKPWRKKAIAPKNSSASTLPWASKSALSHQKRLPSAS